MSSFASKMPQNAIVYLVSTSAIGCLYGALHSYTTNKDYVHPCVVGRYALVGAVTYPIIFPFYPIVALATNMRGCPFKKFH